MKPKQGKSTGRKTIGGPVAQSGGAYIPSTPMATSSKKKAAKLKPMRTVASGNVKMKTRAKK